MIEFTLVFAPAISGVNMFLQQDENLLPRGLSEGAASTRIVSKIQLFRLRGYKKLSIITSRLYFTKPILVASLVLFLSGYQPVIGFPPIKESVAKAEFTQNQSIDAGALTQPFNLPHPGYLTTSFSTWHPGVDIATGLGMPIRPITSGRVIETTYGFWGLGHMVVVEHEQSFRSTYGHMGKIFARVGDVVTSSSILGEVGLTGHTSGPHTHLEITKNSQYIDPLTLLPVMSTWPKEAGVAPVGQGSIKQKVSKPAQPKPTTTPPPSLNLLKINPTSPTNQQSRLPLLPLDRI